LAQKGGQYTWRGPADRRAGPSHQFVVSQGWTGLQETIFDELNIIAFVTSGSV